MVFGARGRLLSTRAIRRATLPRFPLSSSSSLFFLLFVFRASAVPRAVDEPEFIGHPPGSLRFAHLSRERRFPYSEYALCRTRRRFGLQKERGAPRSRCCRYRYIYIKMPCIQEASDFCRVIGLSLPRDRESILL